MYKLQSPKERTSKVEVPATNECSIRRAAEKRRGKIITNNRIRNK